MRISVLLLRDLLTQVGVMGVLKIYPDRVGPMVKLVNHPALVERQIYLFSPRPAVTINEVEALVVQLLRSAKQVRVVGHVEHCVGSVPSIGVKARHPF